MTRKRAVLVTTLSLDGSYVQVCRVQVVTVAWLEDTEHLLPLSISSLSAGSDRAEHTEAVQSNPWQTGRQFL